MKREFLLLGGAIAMFAAALILFSLAPDDARPEPSPRGGTPAAGGAAPTAPEPRVLGMFHLSEDPETGEIIVSSPLQEKVAAFAQPVEMKDLGDSPHGFLLLVLEPPADPEANPTSHLFRFQPAQLTTVTEQWNARLVPSVPRGESGEGGAAALSLDYRLFGTDERVQLPLAFDEDRDRFTLDAASASAAQSLERQRRNLKKRSDDLCQRGDLAPDCQGALRALVFLGLAAGDPAPLRGIADPAGKSFVQDILQELRDELDDLVSP